MVNCISCGKDIADNSKFCRFCSAPQVAKPSVPSCTKCGTVLLPNAKFCKGCGAKITQLDAEKNINEPAEQQPVKLAATPPASIQSAASQPQVQSPSYAKPTPSKNNKSFIYIIIGLVAISLLGFAGYKVWEYKKKTEEQAIIAKQQADAAAQLKAEEEAKIKADIEAKKLLGVDIKTAILQILPDESASFTAPDPLTVRKAFEPCKFSGEGGEISSKCQIQSNGEILVWENVENDRRVDLKTSGARSMVNQIAMSTKFPNDIQSALNGFNDWNIKEVNCGQDTSIDNLTIYTAKPSGKREFVFETSFDGGSGGNWGHLTIHLTPIANNNPCALMNPQPTNGNSDDNNTVTNMANGDARNTVNELENESNADSKQNNGIFNSIGVDSNNANIVAEFGNKIQAKIRSNVNKAICGDGKPEVIFEIGLLPTGELSGIPKLVKSSGNISCDEALEKAIIASEPLPLPADVSVISKFRNIRLKFRPND